MVIKLALIMPVTLKSLNIPNTNAMMPPNLRVVPQHMEMDMTMLGVMYAPNTDLTLMAMAEYVQKTMRMTTYNIMGMRLGDFETKSEGLGDLTISALIRGQKNNNIPNSLRART